MITKSFEYKNMSPMKYIVTILLQLGSFAMIILAAGYWAGAGVDARPKYRDEQTLVGGAIWSQLIIPIGLFISMMVDEPMNWFVYGYFQLSGVFICFITSFVLIYEEYNALKKYKRQHHGRLGKVAEGKVLRKLQQPWRVDKFYAIIGILTLIAGALKVAQYLVFICL